MPRINESLLAWMSTQRDEDLFIASLTVAEIRRGILQKPRGKKRDALDNWFSGPEGPQALFAGGRFTTSGVKVSVMLLPEIVPVAEPDQ